MKISIEEIVRGEWVAVDESTYDGAPDAGALIGRGETRHEAMKDLIEKSCCEHDCINYCTGCDKYFCEIKDENDLKHEEEFPTYISCNSGEYFCHYDCYESYHGI